MIPELQRQMYTTKKMLVKMEINTNKRVPSGET